MNYYIYNNWIASGDKYKLHHWNCGDCHSGLGKHKNVEYGERGVWIGPFDNVRIAQAYISKKGIPQNRFSRCKRCF